jgi:hypothetical protein
MKLAVFEETPFDRNRVIIGDMYKESRRRPISMGARAREMSAASILRTMMKSSPYLAHMFLDLLWTYLPLGQRMRKIKRAFERQLIMQGMSEDGAKRLSVCFEELKNNIDSILKQGMTKGFQSK